MWQYAMRPFTTIDRSPSEILKSCSESSCSANGVSICSPPLLISRMVIGWYTLTSPYSGDGTGTRSLSRLFSSDISCPVTILDFMPVSPTPFHRTHTNGEGAPPPAGKTYKNRNPANTDDLIGVFQDSNAADVDRAIAAAERAYEEWRLVPAPKRAEILFRAAAMLVERKDAFARDMTREMGKVLNETRGDVQEAIDMTYYIAGEGRRMFGQTVPSELRNKFAMSVRQPLGVCSIITPWNFPMAIPSWKIIPALVCGNTIVFKPSSNTP